MKQSPAKPAVKNLDIGSLQDNAAACIGMLSLVATPIGNLSDISFRAAKTLQEADFVAAEDTRVTRKLLAHLKIKKPLVSYRAHNEHETGGQIVSRILAGEKCALVTDAGTPGISDPGAALTRLCIDNQIPVEVIPGPCAAVAALVLSGFACDKFVFEGFLPSQKSKRTARLKQLRPETRTMVFFEAPHRLMHTLCDMRDILGADRRISISRELTKLFEETLRMTVDDALSFYETQKPRGEFVLVVEGLQNPDSCSPASDDTFETAVKTAKELINGGVSLRDAVKKAAALSGCSKNLLYKAVTSEENKE